VTAATLVTRLCEWLDRLFPDEARRERLKAALDDAFAGDDRPVTAELCSEIESVAHRFSRHVEFEFHADGGLVPDRDPPGWPPPDPEEVRRRAGSVRCVRREDDGVGVLALAGHDSLPLAAPYVEAAFALLRGASAVVLDLRRNGGGDPGTLTLVLDWLLGGEPTHVSDVIYKDRTRQWWTPGRPPERSLPAGTPVAVLVSGRTFSSGEGLAYHIQARSRATLVGETTPGAADHVTPVRVTEHVRAVLPEAYVRDAVTGGNWEGTGVVPDLPCDPADALERAHTALTDGSRAAHGAAIRSRR
jgi:C-terminal processing protease CtpA/Prc